MLTLKGKMLNFFPKMMFSYVLTDNHGYIVDVLLFNDINVNIQMWSNVSVGIANGHLWSLITPYLGLNLSCFNRVMCRTSNKFSFSQIGIFAPTLFMCFVCLLTSCTWDSRAWWKHLHSYFYFKDFWLSLEVNIG